MAQRHGGAGVAPEAPIDQGPEGGGSRQQADGAHALATLVAPPPALGDGRRQQQEGRQEQQTHPSGPLHRRGPPAGGHDEDERQWEPPSFGPETEGVGPTDRGEKAESQGRGLGEAGPAEGGPTRKGTGRESESTEKESWKKCLHCWRVRSPWE
jgi:hypothetical protein